MALRLMCHKYIEIINYFAVLSMSSSYFRRGLDFAHNINSKNAISNVRKFWFEKIFFSIFQMQTLGNSFANNAFWSMCCFFVIAAKCWEISKVLHFHARKCIPSYGTFFFSCWNLDSFERGQHWQLDTFLTEKIVRHFQCRPLCSRVWSQILSSGVETADGDFIVLVGDVDTTDVIVWKERRNLNRLHWLTILF